MEDGFRPKLLSPPFLAIVAFYGFISQSCGQTCNPQGYACIDCSTMKTCTGGVPSGIPLLCPVGTVCDFYANFGCISAECFVCIAEGKFPDKVNSNIYHICIAIPASTSSFRKILVQCPNGYTYNPATQNCIQISDTTPTTTTTTTARTPTTTLTTTTVGTTTTIYPCVMSGRYPDVTNCSNYFMCSANTAGGWFAYKYTCPRTTLFSPTVRKCVLAGQSGCTPIAG